MKVIPPKYVSISPYCFPGLKFIGEIKVRKVYDKQVIIDAVSEYFRTPREILLTEGGKNQEFV
jgi:hypothetical protein